MTVDPTTSNSSSTPDPAAAMPSPAPATTAVPFAGISEVDKAKMDYQAHLDLAKVRFWQGARWWELFWDRLIFGATVVVLGGLAVIPINCWMDSRRADEARDLERYKMEEARQRFFLEKRLEAMLAISSAISDVTGVYFAAVHAKQPPDRETVRRDYENALANARPIINRCQLLFSREFNEDVDRYYQVHNQMMLLGLSHFSAYQDMLSGLSTQFDELCDSVLKAAPNEKPKRMTLADISYTERIKKKPKEYLDAMLEHWNEAKKKLEK
jgi:hypothetical protein